MKAQFWRIGIVVVLGCALQLAACGDDDDDGGASATVPEDTTLSTTTPTSTTPGEAAVCDSAVTASESIGAFADVDPETTTVGDVKAAVAQTQAAVSAVAAARGDLAEERVASLESAYANLDATLAAVSDDDTLAEVQTDVNQAIVDVDEAWDAILTEADCS